MFNDRYGLTQAVIEGRKTVTRRLELDADSDYIARHYNPIYRPQHCYYRDSRGMRQLINCNTHKLFIPRYKPGEIVAVAQSYEAAGFDPECRIEGMLYAKKHAGWRNKMFVSAKYMPHQIRITGIKCEWLRGISDDDCFREGISESWYESTDTTTYGYADEKKGTAVEFDTPRKALAALIDRVSGKGTWERNPCVVVYEFELVK